MSGSFHEEERDGELNLKMVALFRQRLWPYMRRYKVLFAVSLACVLISTSCALATPLLLGRVVDLVLVPKKAGLLIPFALLFVGIDLLRGLMMIAQNYLLMMYGQRVLHGLRQDLLRQYQFYPMSEFNRTPTGRLVTRLVNDTSSLQDLFTGGFAVALGEAVIILGIVTWLIILHPSMGAVCVSVFPVMALAARAFGGRIRETFRQSRSALSRLNSYLAENISGMWVIQVFNKQARFRERFLTVSQNYTAKQIETIKAFAFFQPTITILSSLSMSLLVWYGGHRVLHEALTLGLLVTFMSYLQALYAPIRDITEKYNLFVSAMTSCERIFEFMDRPSEPVSKLLPEAPAGAARAGCPIEFKNVWFRYSRDESTPWVLKGLNLKIEPGEKIGIVGHTGAGKTTLTALLLRFHDAQEGEILLDGREIRSMERAEARSLIGYIQQDPFLFSGNIEENILLWEERRREAFEKLPPAALRCFGSGSLSLDGRVFEKGANLSTGQRQIVSFLRALTHDPRLLILDEATAHVDSITEEWIGEVSADAFKSRTVLIIAHRLATLRSVDRIAVLHHGELVESGTHRQLLARKGVYRKLYEIQSRREELIGSDQPPAP
jgi:ATP-binding cassette subfamily B protein